MLSLPSVPNTRLQVPLYDCDQYVQDIEDLAVEDQHAAYETVYRPYQNISSKFINYNKCNQRDREIKVDLYHTRVTQKAHDRLSQKCDSYISPITELPL